MSQEPESEVPSEDLLVHGRAKRATAGNRMQFLMQHLEDDDVRNDLLAEDETDQHDYQLSDTEDVAFGSSDDSDDEGPPRDGQDEDLQGEKELQKAERAEARKKKRKANDFANMPLNPLMKRQRLAATNSLLAPRPRKKSERISWLPTLDDAPTRQSRRRQTVANKEQTEAKLKESQKRSEKAHELMKIAAEKKAAAAAPALTQEDRMKRALKVEKENSRTLNRWEKAEEERQLAQQLRLEALRDRQLEGPVFRYWSGSVIWEGEKIKVKRVHQPQVEAVVEIKPQTAAEVKSAAAAAAASQQTDKAQNSSSVEETKPGHDAAMPHTDVAMGDVTSESHLDQGTEEVPSAEKEQETEARSTVESTKETAPTVTESTGAALDKSSENKPSEDKSTEQTAVPASDRQDASFLDGIHYWASHSPEATAQKDSSSLQTPKPAAAAEPQTAETASLQTQPPQPISFDKPQSLLPQPSDPTQQSATPFDVFPQIQAQDTQPPPPPPPPMPLIRQQAQRSLIILEAFPELESAIPAGPPSKKSSTASTLLSSIILPSALPPLTPQESKYLSSKSAKKKEFLPPPPPRPVCAITAKAAKFRDPKTGIAYQGLEAYKALQRVAAGGCKWGEGWDCWMGILGQGVMGRVARGVPECFVTGVVRREDKEKDKDKDKDKRGDGVKDGVKDGPKDGAAVPASASAPAPASAPVGSVPQVS